MKTITIPYQDHVKSALHAANYGSRAALDKIIRDHGGMIRATVAIQAANARIYIDWVDPQYPVKNGVLDLPAGEWSRDTPAEYNYNDRDRYDILNAYVAMGGCVIRKEHVIQQSGVIC